MNLNDNIHADVIRSKLARDVVGTFKEIYEELVMAMDDLIPARKDSTWKNPRRNVYGSHSVESG